MFCIVQWGWHLFLQVFAAGFSMFSLLQPGNRAGQHRGYTAEYNYDKSAYCSACASLLTLTFDWFMLGGAKRES